MSVRVADFHYELPPELIAQEPVEPRDAAHLLLLERASERLEHHIFRELPELLQPGDCLVANDTRVIPARLLGRRLPGGGTAELLLLHRRDARRWEVLARPGRRLRPGARVEFGAGELLAAIEEDTPAGGRVVAFTWQGGTFEVVLEKLGRTPLPPYIHTALAGTERYQTVYSRAAGSAAAPTAGLHFTPELLRRLAARGIGMVYITLHVGLGTFRPVQVEVVEEHVMHSEWYSVATEAAEQINTARRAGGRLIAVGTTTARTLETQADAVGLVQPGSGETRIFIYPGYNFKAIDGLITNFHLPQSTLLMLVSALAGRERILATYAEAIHRRYRFFSFGDAMLIL